MKEKNVEHLGKIISPKNLMNKKKKLKGGIESSAMGNDTMKPIEAKYKMKNR